MKYFLVIGIVLLFSFLTTSCNTIHGMGTDIKKAGQKIENAL